MKRVFMFIMVMLLVSSSLFVNVSGTEVNVIAKARRKSLSQIQETVVMTSQNIVQGEREDLAFVFEGDLVKKVYADGKLVIENEFYNGMRTVKSGIERCEFTYDSEKNLLSEMRNGVIVTYLYEQDEDNDYLDIVGFNYCGVDYSYTRDTYGRIAGIKDSSGELIAMYEYGTDFFNVEKVLKKSGQSWNVTDDINFIGNINRIRYISAYYDVESDLYYDNGVFFYPTSGAVVMNVDENAGVSLLSYGDDLDYEIYCMQQSYLSSSSFNGTVSQNANWYVGRSDVEVVARVIYGESAGVLRDQDAVACVIRNRAKSRNMTPRAVVLQAEQFEAAKPSVLTARAKNTGDAGWCHAVYMACLLCYTLDNYDWNVLNAIPTGMGEQEYFRSNGKYVNFVDETIGGKIVTYYKYKGEDGQWRQNAVCDIYVVGYGIVSSASVLKSIIGNYPNQNIFFSYC